MSKPGYLEESDVQETGRIKKRRAFDAGGAIAATTTASLRL